MINHSWSETEAQLLLNVLHLNRGFNFCCKHHFVWSTGFFCLFIICLISLLQACFCTKSLHGKFIINSWSKKMKRFFIAFKGTSQWELTLVLKSCTQTVFFCLFVFCWISSHQLSTWHLAKNTSLSFFFKRNNLKHLIFDFLMSLLTHVLNTIK